jgi:outer membrane protein TolC
MRRIVAALLLLCAGAAHAGERLTVEQAVAAALAHNANVASARLEVEKGQTRVDVARTKRLPSLNVDAMGGEALSNLSIEVRDGAGETTRVDLRARSTSSPSSASRSRSRSSTPSTSA